VQDWSRRVRPGPQVRQPGATGLQKCRHKVTQEAAADALETLLAGSLGTVGKVGLRGLGQRVGQVFGTTSGVIRNVKCGALACNVAVNLGIEAAMFTKDVLIAYRKYESGAISRDEFRRALGKHGCEGVGGALGSIGIGIAGQIVVPVPLLGGIVGSILGNLLFRWLGAVIGKKVAAVRRKSDAEQ